jgi:hypothetical protein
MALPVKVAVVVPETVTTVQASGSALAMAGALQEVACVGGEG